MIEKYSALRAVKPCAQRHSFYFVSPSFFFVRNTTLSAAQTYPWLTTATLLLGRRLEPTASRVKRLRQITDDVIDVLDAD